MPTRKNLSYLGIALICFYAVWMPLSIFFILFGRYSFLPQKFLIFSGLPDMVLAHMVTVPSFLVGATLYHWLVVRGRTLPLVGTLILILVGLIVVGLWAITTFISPLS